MKISLHNSGPELSVIIVNYNTGELLSKCVQSIKQTTKGLTNPLVEAIVVDNASIDGFLGGIKNQELRIKGLEIIQNKINLGFAKAVNQGIKKAKGEYILLLNPDAVVKPGAMQKMLEFAKQVPDAGAIGLKLLHPGGSTQASVFHFPTLWRAFKEFWLGQNGAYSKYAPAGPDPVGVDAVVMAAFLITPAARKKVGLLDERYFMYYEDLDYCGRIKEAGLKVYYLPTAEVVHYHGVSGKSLASDENQWRRLIPSSKIYHGVLIHHLINFVLWSGQKWRRFSRD